GITVITAVDEGAPVGFACQSFSALSLEPPLVLFCPMSTSCSWKGIERAGKFCVNILSEEQESVSSTFGRRGEDKFATIDWTPSPMGSPVITGVMAWLDCTIDQILDGGDHWIVLGRVSDLGPTKRDIRPLAAALVEAEEIIRQAPHVRSEADVAEGLEYLLGTLRGVIEGGQHRGRTHPQLFEATGP